MGHKYQSDLLRDVHEAATDLHSIGAITDAKLRWYDEKCLSDDDKSRDIMRGAIVGAPAIEGGY